MAAGCTGTARGPRSANGVQTPGPTGARRVVKRSTLTRINPAGRNHSRRGGSECRLRHLEVCLFRDRASRGGEVIGSVLRARAQTGDSVKSFGRVAGARAWRTCRREGHGVAANGGGTSEPRNHWGRNRWGMRSALVIEPTPHSSGSATGFGSGPTGALSALATGCLTGGARGWEWSSCRRGQ
jgi:hypothetical protein